MAGAAERAGRKATAATAAATSSTIRRPRKHLTADRAS